MPQNSADRRALREKLKQLVEVLLLHASTEIEPDRFEKALLKELADKRVLLHEPAPNTTGLLTNSDPVMVSTVVVARDGVHLRNTLVGDLDVPLIEGQTIMDCYVPEGGSMMDFDTEDEGYCVESLELSPRRAIG